jgi:hypothetical protein
MLCGTSTKRAAHDCFTECVVSRRSFDCCMPPCSATERRRLMTRHTVRYGTNQSSQYTHGWPTAIDTAISTSCTATIRRACVPAGPGARTPRSKLLNSFQPVRPVASRTSLRRNDAREIG